MSKTLIVTVACAAVLIAAGTAAANSHNERTSGEATAELRDAQGRPVGTVTFRESARGVVARIEARGVSPGWHGLHFHMVGRCEGPGFQTAGGHTHGGRASVHGLLNNAATDTGDLPNIHAGPDGLANAEVFSPFVSLRGSAGRTSLLDRDGSAMLMHAMADDHRSQPIGGSGERVACGVLRPTRP